MAEPKHNGKESSSERVRERTPQVEKCQEFCKVAEVKEKVVVVFLLVQAISTSQENNRFLWEKRVIRHEALRSKWVSYIDCLNWL